MISTPNRLGINAFSGPLGEKEPAYGAGERMKLLTALAPVGSPAALNAPKRAKRAAMRGQTARTTAPEAAASQVHPDPNPPQDSYQQQLFTFWHQASIDPDSSDLVRQYAQEVTGGGGQ